MSGLVSLPGMLIRCGVFGFCVKVRHGFSNQDVRLVPASHTSIRVEAMTYHVLDSENVLLIGK